MTNATAGTVLGDQQLLAANTARTPSRFTVAILVAMYVNARRKLGQLSHDTAAKTRRRLLAFARTVPADIRSVNKNHIEAWVHRDGIAVRTQRLHFYDVRSFFRWAVIEGHAKRDPTLTVQPPEQPVSLPGALVTDQTITLAEALPRMEPRTRLIFSLERMDALRRVEVARAELGDIDRRSGVMHVRGKAKGGRGDRTRRIPLHPTTLETLAEYLVAESTLLGIKLVSGPLIRNRWKPTRGVTPGTIGRIVTEELYRLGIKERAWDGVGGHALRHTVATEAAEAGVREEIIQNFLGHEDPASTKIYTKGAVRDLRSFHELRRDRHDIDIIDLRD